MWDDPCKGGTAMAKRQKPTGEAKKPGRTLKEKRTQKQEKQAAQKQARKGWDGK